MDMSTPAPQVWIGIDVSKSTLDVCQVRCSQGGDTGSKPLPKPAWRQFPNDAPGWAKLLQWVQGQGPQQAPDARCHFCLEATGRYGDGVAFFLAEAGQKVSVVNPFRVRHAALGSGTINKTDPVDARVLAEFCRKESPRPWRAAEPQVRALTALLRRLQSLKDQHVQEQNRLAEPGVHPKVAQSIRKVQRFLEKEIGRLEEEIRAHVARHPQLKEDRDLLTSIPGISETTAHWILAELPDVCQFATAQSAAAYVGLAPQEYRSGKSVKKATRLSKQGSCHLRRALFMPALSAPCCASIR